jgi:hypothetical protein
MCADLSASLVTRGVLSVDLVFGSTTQLRAGSSRHWITGTGTTTTEGDPVPDFVDLVKYVILPIALLFMNLLVHMNTIRARGRVRNRSTPYFAWVGKTAPLRRTEHLSVDDIVKLEDVREIGRLASYGPEELSSIGVRLAVTAFGVTSAVLVTTMRRSEASATLVAQVLLIATAQHFSMNIVQAPPDTPTGKHASAVFTVAAGLVAIFLATLTL